MGEFTKQLSVLEVLEDGGDWAKEGGVGVGRKGRCHLIVSV